MAASKTKTTGLTRRELEQKLGLTRRVIHSWIAEGLIKPPSRQGPRSTYSEEQVLAILAQGYSAPQVAVQLKVAVSTVRSHVRAMCTKTHANGVRALVSQLAVLPPLSAARPQEPLH